MRVNTSSANRWAVRGYRAMDRLHRSERWLGTWLAWKVCRLNRWLTGVEIEPGARIGPNFHIHHGQGIVIGRGSVIGRDCHMLHQVTLGKSANTGSSFLGAWPVLGDGVQVYAGATLVGGIRVGDGAVIGANAFVRRDVPDGGIVVAPEAIELPQSRVGAPVGETGSTGAP